MLENHLGGRGVDMPVQLKDGEVDWFLDKQKEILTPIRQGYYLEAIAKIDAHIDVLLEALLWQKCPRHCCKALFQQTEKSVKGIYTTYVTGLNKANVILHLDTPVDGIRTNVKLSKSLYNDIKRFKELRNTVLHSYRGQYNLISEQEMKGIKDDLQFQKTARVKAQEVINVGLKCHSELQALLEVIDVDNDIINRPSMATFFIFEVNHLLDSKQHRDMISFKEAREAAENGQTLKLLRERFGGEIDFSLFTPELEKSFNKRISDIAEVLHNRERRKTGVENNGLTLLIAYATELLQEISRKVDFPPL